MSRRRQLCLVGAAAALVIAPAGAAPVAHTFPKLHVRDNGESVTIEIAHDDLDDPAAKLTIFPPTGYRMSLTQPSGTRIGTVHALVTAPDLGLGPSSCTPTFRSVRVPCVYAIRTGVSARSATLAVVVPSRR